MIKKKKIEKNLLYSEINRLQKENNKLRDENERLRANFERIEKYRNTYEELIGQVKDMNVKYRNYIETIGQIGNEYQKEFERIVHDREVI